MANLESNIKSFY